jgi:hypothetical protein
LEEAVGADLGDHQAVVLVAEAVASAAVLAEADSLEEVLAEAGKKTIAYLYKTNKPLKSSGLFVLYNS